MSDFLEPSPAKRVVQRRTKRDPKPRFKKDITDQYDAMHGCLEMRIRADHDARKVRASVERLDLSELEAKYSSLGTHGYAPARTLAVWVYASQLGIHHATVLQKRMETDLAFLWLSGGYAMSEGHLKKFRRENLAFFEDAVAQTVALAHEDGVLNLEEVAIDSMRLRAEASTAEVRTVKRSKKRVTELKRLDCDALSTEEREVHKAKLAKHESALEKCAELGRPNVVLTNPSAGLMKFPNGASAPGHRLTATVAGVKLRFFVDVLIDPSSTDAQHLGPALMRTRKTLQELGIPLNETVKVVADAGYLTNVDLAAAEENADWADVLVDVPNRTSRGRDNAGAFGVDAFTLDANNTATCPAGRRMDGPYADGLSRTRWNGRGCAECPLKAKCTSRKVRTLTLKNGLIERRRAMLAKLRSEAGAARYRKRIATVEPAFSYLEDVMNYRRASSRLESAVGAEIMMKILTYNLLRLRNAKRLSRVRMFFELTEDGELHFELQVAA